MKTTLQPVNHFQVSQDPAALVLNFDAQWLEQQPFSNASSSGYEFNSARFITKALPVMPIDISFTSIDILWKLDRRTLERMATNPCTPLAVLERLIDHPMADVRAAVADNKNAPMCLLRTLVEDSDPNVRYQLAENHNLPLALLRTLTKDENPYIACRAQDTLNRL